MHSLRCLGACALATLATSCTIGTRTTSPRFEFTFQVIEEENQRPVRGADVFVVFQALSGEERRFGPSETNSDGRCAIAVPEQKFTQTFRTLEPMRSGEVPVRLYVEIVRDSVSLGYIESLPFGHVHWTIRVPAMQGPPESIATESSAPAK
jgi:hypothetical protein